MYKQEPFICPVCWAFQDPETEKCLVCGKKYNILTNNGEPMAMDVGFTNIADYFIPIIYNGSEGWVAFSGRPRVEIEHGPFGSPTGVFSIEMVPTGSENSLFTLTLAN